MTPAKGRATPGPWSYDGHGINSIAESHKGERILKTCLNYSYGSVDRERAIADSHLAAASPMLLEALQSAMRILTAIRADRYAGEALPQLDWILDGDETGDSTAVVALRAAEGE